VSPLHAVPSHDDDPPSPPPDAFTLDQIAIAVCEHRRETNEQYDTLGDKIQSLHNRVDEGVKVAKRQHDLVMAGLRTQADTSLAIAAEISAMGAHVGRLASRFELAELGAQVGRNAADSVTNEHRHEVEIAAVKRLALVRKGAFAFGIAAGTGLALEWRAALKAIVSIFGG